MSEIMARDRPIGFNGKGVRGLTEMYHRARRGGGMRRGMNGHHARTLAAPLGAGT